MVSMTRDVVNNDVRLPGIRSLSYHPCPSKLGPYRATYYIDPCTTHYRYCRKYTGPGL